MPTAAGQGNPVWTREETVLALDLLLSHWPSIPGKQSAAVRNLSELLRRSTRHEMGKRKENFRNTDGIYLKMIQLASLHPANAGKRGLVTSRMDRAVWAELANDPQRARHLADQIKQGIRLIEEEPDANAIQDPTFEATEGGILTRVHRIRERKRGARPQVIRRVERQYGRICCEGCGTKGGLPSPVGDSMFEIHHLVPLAESAARKTTLRDLVLLCANCHRLIHASMRDSNRHLGLSEFQKLLPTIPTPVVQTAQRKR